jgi:hypothetical protein
MTERGFWFGVCGCRVAWWWKWGALAVPCIPVLLFTPLRGGLYVVVGILARSDALALRYISIAGTRFRVGAVSVLWSRRHNADAMKTEKESIEYGKIISDCTCNTADTREKKKSNDASNHSPTKHKSPTARSYC